MAGGLKSAEDIAALRKRRADEARLAGYTHTLSLNVHYNGAPFSGFARQAHSKKATVQGELEGALSLLYKREVKTVCAGRTDAGVHARGQVITFDITEDEFASRPPNALERPVNALVDDAISVEAVQERPLGFSARFDARWREYRYHICTCSCRPVLIAPFVWHLGGADLDLATMNKAASFLVGEHDFKSFCTAASALGKSTHRNVMELTASSEIIMETPVIVVRVVGNAFLHSMVRTIVGTLVEVGRKKRPTDWVGEVLEARSRRVAGQSAPAKGLVLWHVEY